MSDIDPTELEYPDGDRAEVFDLLVHQGAISYRKLMEQIHSMSGDEVGGHLQSLQADGYIDRRDGDYSEDGTTQDLWYIDTGTEQSEGGR